MLTAVISAKLIIFAGGLLGGGPKMPVQPLATDAEAIAKAKTASLMASMAKSGRTSTDLSDKMGGG